MAGMDSAGIPSKIEEVDPMEDLIEDLMATGRTTLRMAMSVFKRDRINDRKNSRRPETCPLPMDGEAQEEGQEEALEVVVRMAIYRIKGQITRKRRGITMEMPMGTVIRIGEARMLRMARK